MKTIGYRIMEFGKFNWDDVITALQIYKSSYGNVDVPLDFVIDESLLEQPEGANFNVDSGRLEGLLLGHVRPHNAYVYIHTHTHTTYTHTHIYKHTHTYIHTHIHTQTHTHIYTYKHIHTHTHTYKHTYIHTHTHIQTHIYKHTHIHTYIHTYILLCIPTLSKQAVASIRIGDVDGFEDPERRAILDDMGFSWGDLSKYQRYRFPPLMVSECVCVYFDELHSMFFEVFTYIVCVCVCVCVYGCMCVFVACFEGVQSSAWVCGSARRFRRSRFSAMALLDDQYAAR